MKVLFDHCIPHPFSEHLSNELEVYTALYLGWDNLSDQDLIEAAEEGDFSSLLTIDSDFLEPDKLGSAEVGIVIVNIHPSRPDHLAEHSDRINSLLLKAGEDSMAYELTEKSISLV